MKPPRVTVLMSIHDGGRWLQAAIDSVLAQTWRDFEFLILDDASNDDGVAQIEAVSDPRIRLIRMPEHIGLTRSLNRGLVAARGEYLARQDSDDLSAPTRLEKQVAFLDRHPRAAVVGAQIELIDAEGKSSGDRSWPSDAASLRWLRLLTNPVSHTAATFRTEVIREEFGGYDESFSCCQDYDLWTRVMESWEVCNLPDRLVQVREHDGSISATRYREGRWMDERVVRRLVPDFSDAEVALALAYRRYLLPAEVDGFRAMLARWDARHPVTDPRVRADLEMTRALLFVGVACNLLAHDRLLALRLILDALRRWPKATRHVPWRRVARTLLEDQVQRLRSRSTSRES